MIKDRSELCSMYMQSELYLKDESLLLRCQLESHPGTGSSRYPNSTHVGCAAQPQRKPTALSAKWSKYHHSIMRRLVISTSSAQQRPWIGEGSELQFDIRAIPPTLSSIWTAAAEINERFRESFKLLTFGMLLLLLTYSFSTR